MNRRTLQLAALAVLAALVIAIFMRDAVEQLIIRPVAYIFWWLGVLYRFVPQTVLWFLLVLVMLFLTLDRILRKLEWPRLGKVPKRTVLGPVGEFASQIEHKGGGIYFKWQVARTLGEIAMDLQSLHQPVRRRKLDFDKAPASMDVVHYLDAGIHSSFSDYPLKRGFLFFGRFPLPDWLPFPERFRSVPLTPFDIDIEPVIDYLEAQMENNNDFRRP